MKISNIPLAQSYLMTAHNYLTAMYFAPKGADMPKIERAAFRNLANALNELGLEMGIKPEPEPLRKMPKSEFMARIDGLNTPGADVEGR